MTPVQVFSKLGGQRRFLVPFLPAPRVTRRDQGQAGAPDHIIEAVVTETIRAAPATARYCRSYGEPQSSGRLSDSARAAEQSWDLGHSRVAGV